MDPNEQRITDAKRDLALIVSLYLKLDQLEKRKGSTDAEMKEVVEVQQLLGDAVLTVIADVLQSIHRIADALETIAAPNDSIDWQRG